MVGITTDSKSKLLAITDATRFPKAGESKVERVAPYALTSGWYYNFNSQKVQSEKVMSTPIVINNDMYVTTFDGSKPGLFRLWSGSERRKLYDIILYAFWSV